MASMDSIDRALEAERLFILDAARYHEGKYDPRARIIAILEAAGTPDTSKRDLVLRRGSSRAV